MAWAFVSGATGGIGKAFAKECASSGFDLFLTSRSTDKLAELEKEIASKYSVNILTFACDLTSDAEIQSMIDFMLEKGVRFKRILNVAGVDTQKGFLDYTLQKVLFQINVNAKATISLTHQLLKISDGAEVLTVSSMSGVSPMPYFALYSATKAMLTNFFTALHYELKPQGIKVTTVLPGGVYTRADVIEDIKGQGLWGKLSAKSPEFVAKKSLKALQKNKVKYIPGAFNKLLNFVMKLLPKGIVLRFIARRWKKQTKDAF